MSAFARYHGPMASMNTRDRTAPRLGRGLGLPLFAVSTVLATGCAEPCIDDGLGQSYCPAEDSETSNDSADSADTVDTADSNAEDSCELLDVILIPQIPTMVLLVDQSGSMTQGFGDGTRWTVTRDVLVADGTGIVAQFESGIRFGLTLYTSVNGNLDGEVCPMLVEVPPALDNFTAIQGTFDMSAPAEDTPTGESLAAVTAELDALEVAGRKYIVLATDGEPDTCAEPDPQNGQDESVAAAEAAYAAGIETFVISVGDEVSDAHLQDLANAGAGVGAGDPDAPFYKALDEAALVTAFEEILAGVRSCELDLDTPVDDPAGCTVFVNGSPVALDDPNGWQLNDPTEAELVGDACETLQQGTSSVSMECACEEGA